jgi:hypothetical protein
MSESQGDYCTKHKHPNLILQMTVGLEIGYGEASGMNITDKDKDAGDLCRLGIWSKKCLDIAHIKFEGLSEHRIPFFQALGKNITVYWMRRVSNILCRVEGRHHAFG